ncbi:DUF4138 domain-containing protein [Flagellimonas marinaquae]|uniref:DUF4138 domain-containing protein n=1 Tax=Flagellimonas marinaquae TaxID=254955 RepID=UPI000F8DFD2D|nr:DUF4138 domain-containing protein [Allomuricauda aquimarina]
MKYQTIFPLIILFFFTLCGTSQSLDTIYANAHQVVSLTFPNPIQTGMTGAQNFAFSFDREKADHLGLLQADKDQTSNLLVRTTAGNLYSFILAYQEDLLCLHYFIGPEQRLINPFQPDSQTKEVTGSILKKPAPQEKDFTLLCTQLLDRESSAHKWSKRQKGIRAKLIDQAYHNDQVYMVYELRNRSTIPYDLGLFQLSKVLGTPKRKASYQELPITPLFEFQIPKQIGAGETVRFAVVYPKFTLNSEEHLQLKVLEAHGSRNLIFKIVK